AARCAARCSVRRQLHERRFRPDVQPPMWRPARSPAPRQRAWDRKPGETMHSPDHPLRRTRQAIEHRRRALAASRRSLRWKAQRHQRTDPRRAERSPDRRALSAEYARAPDRTIAITNTQRRMRPGSERPALQPAPTRATGAKAMLVWHPRTWRSSANRRDAEARISRRYNRRDSQRLDSLNPRLTVLQPYPFERLRALVSTVVPDPAKRPIALSIGAPRHPTPRLG